MADTADAVDPANREAATTHLMGTPSRGAPSTCHAPRPVRRAIGGPLRRVAAVLIVGSLAVACGSSDDSSSADGASDLDTASQSATEEWQALEDYLVEQADAGAFSGAIAVSEDGEPLVEQAYGLADREANRPNDTETRFNIGSLGKMFTAVAIAQLVEQGKLAFDDRIGDHISGLPADIADVTVDQLLTHTSGLGDFISGGYPEEAKSAQTATELLPLVVSQPLEFEPGTRESYSNSGYVVLGAIIEAITGQSYYDYVGEQIFKATGMTRTGWSTPGRDTDNTALGYMAARGNLPPLELGGGAPSKVTLPSSGSNDAADDAASGLTDNSEVVPWGNPSGGAYSTVGDLLRFSEALLDNKLLSPEMTATVMDGKVAMSNGDAEVAYGFTDGTLNGVRIVGHGAGAPGVGAAIDIYPDLGYVVVILANYDGALDPVRDATKDILSG